MDAVPFELQIQIGVSKSAGTPMFRHDDFAGFRLELGTELATPSAIFEALARPRCFLNRRNVLPILIVAWAVAAMNCIEHPKLGLPCCVQDSQHVRNTLISFSYRFDTVPYLAPLRNEVVIWIDHQKSSDLPVIG